MISLVLCINLGVAVFPAAAAGTPVGLPQKSPAANGRASNNGKKKRSRR